MGSTLASSGMLIILPFTTLRTKPYSAVLAVSYWSGFHLALLMIHRVVDIQL